MLSKYINKHRYCKTIYLDYLEIQNCISYVQIRTRYNTYTHYMVVCYRRFSNSDENDRKKNNRKQLRY